MDFPFPGTYFQVYIMLNFGGVSRPIAFLFAHLQEEPGSVTLVMFILDHRKKRFGTFHQYA